MTEAKNLIKKAKWLFYLTYEVLSFNPKIAIMKNLFLLYLLNLRHTENNKMKFSDEHINVLVDNSSLTVSSFIKEIISQSGNQEDPFFVCNVTNLVEKYNNWVKKMPRIKPFYAVKCNDSLIVLKTLAALGASFDCASKNEIKKVMSLGVSTKRIIYANPTKSITHIKYAASSNVDLMTFDNEIELYKIKSIFPNARMVIRIRCDDENAETSLGNKFGCDPFNEAPRLLKIAYEIGINVIGVSFHVGSGAKDASVFKKAISTCRDIFDFAINQIGFTNFYLLDIGGGFPGDTGTSIDKFAYYINQALDKYFPDSSSVQVIAEPGRYFVASAFTIACCVHSVRFKLLDKKKHYMYYINEGIFGSFNNILCDNKIVVPKLLKEYPNTKMHSSSIWGPSCHNQDVLIKEIILPELQIGDWLIFEDMGAYTITVATPFNGFPVPKILAVVEEKTWSLNLKERLLINDEDCVILENISNKFSEMKSSQDEYKFGIIR